MAEGVGVEADARLEGGVRVGEGLAVVAEAGVQHDLVREAVVVLREDGVLHVIDGVAGVAVALLIVGYVGDVVQEGWALAEGFGLRDGISGNRPAGVVGELAEIDGAAELLAVAAGVRVDDVSAEDELVPAHGAGERVAELELVVHEERGLAGSRGEGGRACDGNAELRSVDDGNELRDGRAELELRAEVVDEVGREDGGVAEFLCVRPAMEGARDTGQRRAADDAVGVGVGEAVVAGAEEGVVARAELAVEAEEAEEVVIVADEVAGRERRGDGAGAVLLAELAGEEEVGGVVLEQAAGEGRGGLVERVVGDFVAAGGGVGVEAGEFGLRAGGAVELEHAAVKLVAAGAGDDVDDAAGAAAVLGGEGVGEDGHLGDGVLRDVGEDGLAAPAVVGVAAVDFKPGLAAARAVGGEEVLVHEDVALVNGGAVGRVEQRKEGDAAVEQRRLFDLCGAEAVA